MRHSSGSAKRTPTAAPGGAAGSASERVGLRGPARADQLRSLRGAVDISVDELLTGGGLVSFDEVDAAVGAEVEVDVDGVEDVVGVAGVDMSDAELSMPGEVRFAPVAVAGLLELVESPLP